MYRGPPESGGTAPLSRLAPALNAGAGMRFFLNRWITVRGELRDLVYSETIVVDAMNKDVTSLRNQLVFEVGVSLFFPPTFTEP
jgi:outer membrane beta-barrel protein